MEEACLNACPSPREIILGDRWLVRIAGGATRRTNAVNPLRSNRYDPTPVIAPARRLYHAHGRPSVFRVPSIAPGLDASLDRTGFIASDPVSTLVADLGCSTLEVDPDVDLTNVPSADWLAAKVRLTPKVGATPDIYHAMVAAIVLPKAFAAISYAGTIAAVAYGALNEDILVLESVVTDPALRRRGHGRRIVGTLMAWARDDGAQLACLQVESENTPAVALYESVGFETELYRYRYRVEPHGPPSDATTA